MLSKKQTIKEQFRSFYNDHKPKNFEDALEKFAIFGGVEWGEIDTSKDSYELIEKLILQDYRYIRNDITELTDGLPLYHTILSAIALGDGKTHSVFKRANVSAQVGANAVEDLVERGIIKVAASKTGDDKLFFTLPFIRFWFAFISPIFKGIRDGEFDEAKTRWQNHKAEFIQEAFSSLSREVIKENLKDMQLMKFSNYTDENIDLEIYATTKDKKIIVGSSKYTNAKVKKSELTRLKELCAKADIKADLFVLMSKNGFSSELKSLKGKNLKLFTIKNFKELIA
jgi:hypothetical protein